MKKPFERKHLFELKHLPYIAALFQPPSLPMPGVLFRSVRLGDRRDR